jgi:hypothetical protein
VRTVESIDANTSRFTYRLTFDPEIFRPVMPEPLPVDSLVAWYGEQMDGYLATLKAILETMVDR